MWTQWRPNQNYKIRWTSTYFVNRYHGQSQLLLLLSSSCNWITIASSNIKLGVVMKCSIFFVEYDKRRMYIYTNCDKSLLALPIHSPAKWILQTHVVDYHSMATITTILHVNDYLHIKSNDQWSQFIFLIFIN